MSIKQRTKSLKSRESELASTFFQLKVLNGKELFDDQFPSFSGKLKDLGYENLRPAGISIFQVNVGKMCNQTCGHCHVDAGPDRKEIMTKETLQQCLDIIKHPSIQTVDITGGAPEMTSFARP